MDKLLKVAVGAMALMTTQVWAVTPSPYLGASIGQSQMEESLDGSKFDGSDTAFKIFGGFRFNDFLAAEASYTDFGEPDDSVLLETIRVNLSADVQAWELSGVGIIPLSQRFELFGKIGIVTWDADVTGTTDFFSTSESDSGTDLTYGVGARFFATPNLAIRGEWQFYDIDGGDLDTDMLSAGVAYYFF